MSKLMRLETPTYIITATTTAVTFNAQPSDVDYDFIVIKNEGTSPVAVAVNATSVAAVYPTAGTDATVVPQNCKTILPGQVESYQKDPKNGYVSVVLIAGGTNGPVHISLGADK